MIAQFAQLCALLPLIAMTIIAQVGTSYTLIQWIVIVIVIAGIIGIALVVVRQAGISIPGWVVQILWIVLAVVVAVVAIKFLAGLI